MKLVANKPCTLSGKRYFIGEEIPAEAVTDSVALEKMGVLTVIRDGVPVETLEECVASVGEVFFKIEIVKGDKGFDLDVTEPQLQEAVKTMQMISCRLYMKFTRRRREVAVWFAPST